MYTTVDLCIPVLRRYDTLRELLVSLRSSTVAPRVRIIDNGQQSNQWESLMDVYAGPVIVHRPDKPMGVAESWNWFIRQTVNERIIANDDVTFASTSIQQIIDTPGDFVGALDGRAFSCFLLRDSLVKRIGVFDETISPGYGYFEDLDYEQRMYDEGISITHVSCGVLHYESSTLRAASRVERALHDKKFMIAKGNFVKKWGRLPRGMENDL